MDLQSLAKKELDVNALLRKIVQKPEIKAFILRLNRQQLYNKGEDSKGESLGEYSPFTIEEKRSKGQPFDRITLFDSGEFYNSFYIKVSGNEIEILSDPIKDDGTNLLREFGEDILGLTEEDQDKLSEMIEPMLAAEILKFYTGG